MERTLELSGPARRFAGTTFGIKTRIAPLSAAIARVQLQHMSEHNSRRNQNLRYLSERLEGFGFDTFLGPSEVERVYFRFMIRYDEQRWGLPLELLAEALRAEGCDVELPGKRYPLLHQQPLFTEGHLAQMPAFRNRPDAPKHVYKADALPQTEAISKRLLRLPTFPSAGRELLDQYAMAFEKVLSHAEKILGVKR
jgi:dTDP-4-amino-4,6-dideoxygalactose transaminase